MLYKLNLQRFVSLVRDPLRGHKISRQSINCFDIRCKINCGPEALAVTHVSQITLPICEFSRRLRETMRHRETQFYSKPITKIVGG